MENLKPCPICNKEVKVIGGPETWKPSFYDPDSGGDAYFVSCDCGLFFSPFFYEYEKFVDAWNRRVAK